MPDSKRRWNINDLRSFTTAQREGQGLEEGDICHIAIVGNHVRDNAIYLGPLGRTLEKPYTTGLRFRLGDQEIDLPWGDVIECWKI